MMSFLGILSILIMGVAVAGLIYEEYKIREERDDALENEEGGE